MKTLTQDFCLYPGLFKSIKPRVPDSNIRPCIKVRLQQCDVYNNSNGIITPMKWVTVPEGEDLASPFAKACNSHQTDHRYYFMEYGI